MQPSDLPDVTTVSQRPRTTESRDARERLVGWYCSAGPGTCSRCTGRKQYAPIGGTTPEPVPAFMTYVGRKYGEDGCLPLLFVGLNPRLEDEWVDSCQVVELALWWEYKVYAWLDYRLGPVLEAIAPLAEAIWTRASGREPPADGRRIGRVAFTNIVKCARCDAGDHAPTEEMERNCLPFLAEEIRILEPGLVVTFGNEVWDVLATAVDTPGPAGLAFSVGDKDTHAAVTVDERTIPVLTLPHPSGRSSESSPEAYVESAWFGKALDRCLRLAGE